MILSGQLFHLFGEIGGGGMNVGGGDISLEGMPQEQLHLDLVHSGTA